MTQDTSERIESGSNFELSLSKNMQTQLKSEKTRGNK